MVLKTRIRRDIQQLTNHEKRGKNSEETNSRDANVGQSVCLRVVRVFGLPDNTTVLKNLSGVRGRFLSLMLSLLYVMFVLCEFLLGDLHCLKIFPYV